MSNIIQYGKQTIDDDDISQLTKLLQNNEFLTTGPKVPEFENKISEITGIKYAVAVSNGTAALHCACYAIGLNKDDEVIVPAISFIASSNCLLYLQAKPIFCDVDPNTMNIDPDKIEALVTPKTKAIITVDFAGQLCDYPKIKKIADRYKLLIIEDAAHSFGAKLNGNYVDLITLSFHPVKTITTGEGGMILTNNEIYEKRMKLFRNHGIDKEYSKRDLPYYDMIDLGYNFRLSDLHCCLGLSQLKKLNFFIKRRTDIVKMYKEAFKNLSEYFTTLEIKNDSSYHIFIIILNKKYDREKVIYKYKEKNIMVNIHYKPIYLHTYYMNHLNTHAGLCPIAEELYKNILTIPLYPLMTDDDVNYVIDTTKLIFR